MAKATIKRSHTSLKIAWLCMALILLGAYIGLELTPPLPDPTAVTLAVPSPHAIPTHQMFNAPTQESITTQGTVSAGMERLGDNPSDNHQSDVDEASSPQTEAPQSGADSMSKLSWPEERVENEPASIANPESSHLPSNSSLENHKGE